VLHELVDKRNTVIVIETIERHKTADWIIDPARRARRRRRRDRRRGDAGGQDVVR